MKIAKYIIGAFVLFTLTFSCTEQDGLDDDLAFLKSQTSNSLYKVFDISNDNSGLVKITPIGNGFNRAIVNFGHGTGAAASAEVKSGASTNYTYPEGNYNVVIDYYDIVGNKTSASYPLTVTFRAPEEIKPNISISNNGVSVKATALYAKSFVVYFGEDANETGTPIGLTDNATHVYKAAGTYNIKVVALSGGAAKSEVVTPKEITFSANPFALPITFDDAAVKYFFGTFGGGQAFNKVENPDKTGIINKTDSVGVFTRGFESWSGTYSPLNRVIQFSAGKKITLLAYNTDPALIGKAINLELEAAVGGNPKNGVGVKKVAFTKSGAWEELVFDYTDTAIPENALFAQIVFRFNDAFNGEGVGGKGAKFYIDSITQSK